MIPTKEVTDMENKAVLNQFKTEIANELGISNYEQIDKGQLTSRQNGYVGGNMTKKMVAFAEQAIAQGQTAAINSAAQTQQMR
ncbi:MAG: alpha/beta-type small acid-soluble spore protein [Firmicutes bacterium]|nr:alpha/beta-type small acid-soluble spore protein [Bacillota bacterium]